VRILQADAARQEAHVPDERLEYAKQRPDTPGLPDSRGRLSLHKSRWRRTADSSLLASLTCRNDKGFFDGLIANITNVHLSSTQPPG
jgi:hypothetical protein